MSHSGQLGDRSENEMARAYRQDYEDKGRMDDVRRAIDHLLIDPPASLEPGTRRALELAAKQVQADSDRITRVWD